MTTPDARQPIVQTRTNWTDDWSDEPHLEDLPRLTCIRKRGMAGRFRQLIDCINEA